MNKIVVEGVTCVLQENSIVLKGSHNLSVKEIRSFCNSLKNKTAYNYVRTAGSWTGEILVKKSFNFFKKFSVRVTDIKLDDFDFVPKLMFYDLVYGIYSIFAFFGNIGDRHLSMKGE